MEVAAMILPSIWSQVAEDYTMLNIQEAFKNYTW